MQPDIAYALYRASLGQAIAGGILVLATIALVWATFRLVKATNLLARVGEEQWKSNVRPTLWLMLDEMRLTDSHLASWSIRNACAVDISDLSVKISSSAFALDMAGNFVADAITPVENEVATIGVLKKSASSASQNYWKHAQSAVNLPASVGKVPNVVGGLIFAVIYTHGITGQVYSYEVRFVVADTGKGTLEVKRIGKTKPQIVD